MYSNNPLGSGQKQQNQKMSQGQSGGLTHQLNGTYLQELAQCEEHPNEMITNFCSCLECLRPLCPECVTIHNQQHKLQHTYAEIETVRNVKQRCETKLLTAADFLEQQMSNCQNSLSLPSGSIEENINILRKYRKRVDEILDSHFKNLEEQLLHNSREIKARYSQFLPTFDKMKQAIAELKDLNSDLDQRNNIESLQKVCQLDVQHMITKFKGELNRITSSLCQEFLVPKLDESRVYYLAEELERTVSVKLSEVLDQNFFTGLPFSNSITPNNVSPKQLQQSTSYSQKNQIETQKHVANLSQKQPQHLIQEQPQFQSHQSSLSVEDIIGIGMNDYFDKKAPRKFLHFFQNDDNKLHFLDLDEIEAFESKSGQRSQQMNNRNQNLDFHSVDLQINFRISSFHKSISTPSGELYLTGGTIPDGSMRKSGQIFQYEWNQQNLVPIGNMNFPRSSHGIAYMAGYIYIVGGYEHKHVMTKRCERFDINTRRWQVMSPLNFAAASHALCSFDDRYLFKFGGIGEGYEDQLLSPYIERYDSVTDQWQIIDPQLANPQRLQKLGFHFGLLSTSAAVQISQTEIFVFGGYHEDNSGSNQSFILQILQDGKQNAHQYTIKNINSKLLPCSEAFWNNVPIIHNRKLYALQNISGENSDNCLENERKILVFNQREWKSLN